MSRIICRLRAEPLASIALIVREPTRSSRLHRATDDGCASKRLEPCENRRMMTLVHIRELVGTKPERPQSTPMHRGRQIVTRAVASCEVSWMTPNGYLRGDA